MAEGRQPTKLKRFLFLGPTGAGKSKMINCCYNRSIAVDALRQPAAVAIPTSCIGTTSSLSNYVDQRNKIIYVDTIGYGDVRFHQNQESFVVFFHELICYSSIGFNWIFVFLRYQQISEDTFLYIQTIEQLLGKKALSRCTIVFTHCPEKEMTLEKFIDANQQHEELKNILRSVNNVIFGDMETENKYTMARNAPSQMIEWLESELFQQRYQFMQQMLIQIDSIDDKILELQQDWIKYYCSKFKAFVGYCWEKIVRKPNELSKLYKLTSDLKEGIALIIYYQECSICLELIVEVVNHSPQVCVTKCGHVFHYHCLKRAFDEKKECPNCRTNLRNIPERISALVAGFKQILDPLKANVH